jgi:hypothetical protein
VWTSKIDVDGPAREGLCGAGRIQCSNGRMFCDLFIPINYGWDLKQCPARFWFDQSFRFFSLPYHIVTPVTQHETPSRVLDHRFYHGLFRGTDIQPVVYCDRGFNSVVRNASVPLIHEINENSELHWSERGFLYVTIVSDKPERVISDDDTDVPF